MKDIILNKYGFRNISCINYNLSTPALYEAVIKRVEGILGHLGPIVVRTGHHTGRSANDKYIVKTPSATDIYWSKDNKPLTEESFDRIFTKIKAYLQTKEIFIQDCYAGKEVESRIKVRVITEYAWHSLFARNMFVKEPDRNKLENFIPDWTVIDLPRFHANPEEDGTNSETFIIVNLDKQIVLIGGTSYAGEIKKSIFTVMNHILPKKGVMSMHCSANVGEKGDVAIFFGLSGTGKTTLSTDPHRYLIGDDEHGWSENGIFNIEGGCYAKVINLSKEAEPEIYETTRKFGTILENVSIDVESRRIDLNDGTLTENTRASYPITHLTKIIPEGTGGHPENIIFLTFDAFGVLPPVVKLNTEQAMYHFVSGYTAKVAGTEKGVTEPVAVFSACFGAPFMVLHPFVYANILAEKIKKHNVKCWLVNTGLTGGPYGIGKRFKIQHTRKIINSIIDGSLNKGNFVRDSIFGYQIPENISDIPKDVVHPKLAWKDPEMYEYNLKKLAEKFVENFEKYKVDKNDPILIGSPKP